jgi:16S rRNA (adenine1518-N6/adenine1519-N6)-dimethyltransferase
VSTDDPRVLLRRLEQRARRRFGQHFLTATSMATRMVRGARVIEGDRVLEVGPGLGILTSALEDAGAQITAIELDRDLAAFMREEHPGVRLIEGDALAVDWADAAPGSGWKMVANLPYNVGTHMLMRALRQPERFASVTVMLQLEVVHRLMAEPGTKAYNSLSVEAQVRGAPVFLLKLPPGAFHPPPKVESAVVRFDLFPEPRVGAAGPKAFDRVVRAAFAQRRKMISNSLAATYGKAVAKEALASCGIDPQLRAEVLPPERFGALALALEGLVRTTPSALSDTVP